MRKLIFAFAICFCSLASFSLNITIIESQSINSGHNMDVHWGIVVAAMGHTYTIAPQTTLDNTAFFASTDILIVSSGVINIPMNRRNIILQFLQTGKPVYLQSEYLSTFESNITFAYIIASLGGSFTWTGTFSGDLNPMIVLGSYATTNNAVSPLTYFWYSDAGTGDCNTLNILQYGGQYHGFQYIPVNPSYGSIITTADQDWIGSFTANDQALMQNLITHLINPPTGGTVVQVNLGPDTTLCQGNNLLLNATTPGASYHWQDNSTNPTFNVTQAGTFWVIVTVGPCSGVDTIHVGIQSQNFANLGNDTTLCSGSSLILDATTSGASYLWQNSSTNATFNVTQAGTYWVSVTIGGCSASDTITVNYAPDIMIDLGNDTTICSGSSVLLDATTTGATYLWQDNSTSAIYAVTQTGNYWVIVSANGCSSRDSITVTANPLPAFDLGNDTAFCQGDTLLLDATTANASYLWQDNSTGATLAVSQTGTYWAMVNVNGCASTDSIVVTAAPLPTADLGTDTSFCEETLYILDATYPGATYYWNDGSTGATYNVTEEGLYRVNITVNGCSSSDSIRISYEDCNMVLYIPNIFSPNDDTKNDVFVARGEGVMTFSMIIYDRWGERVFESEDLSKGWDGKFRGKDCDSGVFVYYVNAKMMDGATVKKKGTVTLIR